MQNSIAPKKHVLFLYLLPGFLLYTFVVVVPIFVAAYCGFFSWSGGPRMKSIGFQNYAELFKDGVFWLSFRNNILLTVISAVGQIGIAFLFASLLSSRLVYAKAFHRTVIFLPCVFSAVVVGFIWSMIYDYNYGLINQFLKLIGKGGAVKPWLSNPKWSLVLVTIPLVWQYIGYYMVILLSAFSSIDRSVLEMAELDGATGWKKAVYITLPLLKNTLFVCLTLCIAGSMRVFDNIYVMTGGGPGNSSSVMALYAYNTSFVRYRMGYGSAMSILILALSLLVIGGSRGLLARFSRKEET
ncbi:MAG TPA: sugar ABC transporter permease [Ruminococcaceae bacterium]|nr:sugar ABC transporter permease [Oscillospiraceae bacterium]HBT90882.1 sugar ABC transporter permease [Oscillospiraceae bacterium]